jgi:hypothetical protein
MATCPTCKGKCRCPKCDGHGRDAGFGGFLSNTCPLCKGSKVCPTCNGKGTR